MRALLVGNPNSGKTTLFNALTGANQRVGNWPGVTTEQKTGSYSYQQQTVQLVDLPGVYSLSSFGDASPDERIATEAIVKLDADLIINVVDACHLERHLYLTSQILELKKPVIIVLTMMDLAKQQGIHINEALLAKHLGCVVISLQVLKNIGLSYLQEAIHQRNEPTEGLTLNFSPSLLKSLLSLEQYLIAQGAEKATAFYSAHRLLESGTALLKDKFGPELVVTIGMQPDYDILLADARYEEIHRIVGNIQQKKSDSSNYFTAKLDRILLHRYLALPIFFVTMYLMFLFAINIGGVFQDFFDLGTETIFVHGSARVLEILQAPSWFIAIIANGVGKGINTTLTFIPVLSAMYFFLAFLEASGYMARAAFVVDKAMRFLGLPGKSFIPLIVGFGCNVPAILAARTLDSEQDRLLTVLMSPFMSCSARLAIYTVFVAAFFPEGGQNIVFALYLIGILMAVLTGFILRKTWLRGESSPLILELPPYHRPTLKRLLKETSFRLRYFISRAGRLIIPVCVILGGLNAFTLPTSTAGHSQSLLAILGQALTPLFSPIGLHQDNWPATVGLLTGMLAKEVVIGSLNSLYTNMEPLSYVNFDFFQGLLAAFWTIPHHLANLGSALANPIVASAGQEGLSQSVYGIMMQRFDGQAGAFAYLLFILLYIPCVSTMAVIRQEASSKWMWFSISWSFIMAYLVSTLFYQAATYAAHPQQTITWYLVVSSSIFFAWIGFYGRQQFKERAVHVAKNS